MPSCCHCRAEPAAPDFRPAREWMRMGLAALVAAQSMIFSLAINLSPPSGMARTVLHAALAVSAVAVFALLGGPVLRAAWQPRIVVEQLFLAGIFGAFAASVYCSLTGVGHVYYEVVAVLLAIDTLGRALGERRRSEVLAAAEQLDREFDPPAPAGGVVEIAAGGPVTVDGVILEGAALVRETALTGEPFPVVKRPGDPVLAGSRSLDGALRVRPFAGERKLDELLRAVRDARRRPARLQREADRLAAWFLPAVMGIALAVFAIGGLRGEWMPATFNALAVILVACPCSLGLATPIGLWSALAELAQRGILARSGDLVEKLARVNAVIFDKTGTLGEEAMQLVDFVALGDREALLREVSALQRASDHPIAAAFAPSGEALEVSELELLPGVGLRGRVGGHLLEIGNSRLAGDIEPLRRLLREESHLVVIRRDGALAGLASLRERLRATSLRAIAELEAAGLACRIFTGDQTAPGLERAETGMSPLQKRDRVAALQRTGERILFVGDGMNDAPALAQADAALAVASGSALARESADGEILGGNLLAVPEAIALCRRTLRVIRGNLYFAAGYNLIGISLAAAGLLHPVAAALLMLASSFTVSWRALRASPPAAPMRRNMIEPPFREALA
ncbi:MAG TPA: heavy metal translocating P-type ATPase [Chthoniobacterales bacterium]